MGDDVKHATAPQREVLEKGNKFAESKYSTYLEGVKNYYRQHRNSEVPENIKASLGTSLENTRQWLEAKTRQRRVTRNEQLTEADLGTFVRYGFELISAILPTSVLDDLVSVQPMDRDAGKIFYMDVVSGTDKGTISEGDTLFDAQTGTDVEGTFSKDIVRGEPTGSNPTVSGTVETYDSKTNQFPVIKDSFVVRDTDPDNEIDASDDGNGNIVGSDVEGTGSIDYDTGEYSFSIDQGAYVGSLVLDFSFSYNRNPANTPKTKLQIRDKLIQAEKRQLVSEYLLDAAFELEQHYGKNIDQELLSILAGEVRAELDEYHLDQIKSQAPGSTVSPFNDSAINYVSQNERNEDFKNTVIAESSLIEDKTSRMTGKWVAAGKEVIDLVEGIDAFDKADVTAEDIAGPHFRGTLWDKQWYKVPHWANDEYVVGSKGDSFLQAGYVFAPFIPLMVTDVVPKSDLRAERGLLTSNASDMVNKQAFLHNKIVL